MNEAGCPSKMALEYLFTSFLNHPALPGPEECGEQPQLASTFRVTHSVIIPQFWFPEVVSRGHILALSGVLEICRYGCPLEVLLWPENSKLGRGLLFSGFATKLAEGVLRWYCLGTPTQLHEVWGHEKMDRQTWLFVLGLEQGLTRLHISLFSPCLLYSAL